MTYKPKDQPLQPNRRALRVSHIQEPTAHPLETVTKQPVAAQPTSQVASKKVGGLGMYAGIDPNLSPFKS